MTVNMSAEVEISFDEKLESCFNSLKKSLSESLKGEIKEETVMDFFHLSVLEGLRLLNEDGREHGIFEPGYYILCELLDVDPFFDSGMSFFNQDAFEERYTWVDYEDQSIRFWDNLEYEEGYKIEHLLARKALMMSDYHDFKHKNMFDEHLWIIKSIKSALKICNKSCLLEDDEASKLFEFISNMKKKNFFKDSRSYSNS